jgi:hypothetical protein
MTNLLLGELSLSNAVWLKFEGWWNEANTLFDFIMILEGTIGVIYVTLTSLSTVQAQYYYWLRMSRPFFAGSEILLAGSYIYMK